MPADLYNLILEQRAQLLTISSHINNFYNDMYGLSVQLSAEGCPGSANAVQLACVHLLEWRDQIADGTDNFRYALTKTLLWINDNWVTDGGDGEPPYELTAEKICEAWAADNFQARALTIAFIDRMRQLIWDEPFFVAWAARPE